MLKFWLKQGSLNSLEHFISRFLDAGLSFFLIWAFAPELFAKIAIGQAVVAPLLFFFISPETVIYRDYAKWKSAGFETIQTNLAAFERFNRLKVVFALLFSIAIGAFRQDVGLVWALVWSFSLVLTPQLIGPNREFLRLEFRMYEINLLAILQKVSLFILVFLGIQLFGNRISIIAIAGVVSGTLTYCLSRLAVKRLIESIVASDVHDKVSETNKIMSYRTSIKILIDSIRTFSLWNHINGVIHGWLQSMSILAMGYFMMSDRLIGLFGATLKFCGFSLMLPTALGQVFSIWIGRRLNNNDEMRREIRMVILCSGLISVAAIAQALVMLYFADWGFELFSRGRWDPAEVLVMIGWSKWLLAGNALLGPVFLITSWCNLRFPNRELTVSVYLPVLLMSILAYFALLHFGIVDSPAVIQFSTLSLYLCLCVFTFGYRARSGPPQKISIETI